MTDKAKTNRVVASILRIGGSAGLVVFATQLMKGGDLESAVFRGFIAAAAVSVVVVAFRVAILYGQAAAARTAARQQQTAASAATGNKAGDPSTGSANPAGEPGSSSNTAGNDAQRAQPQRRAA